MIRYAPGKLMIAGEYSVLFGGKSLVAACSGYQAIARFEPFSSWAFFARTNNSYIGNTEHKLFVATKKAAELLGVTPQRGSYFVDTSAFYNIKSGHKLGLGSSAAGIVALAKLFLAQHNLEDRALLLKLALDANKNFSSTGSGADIAAAVYENTIKFYNTKATPIVEPLELPWWPEFIWVDTLRPQNTRIFVTQVLNKAQKDLSFIAQFVEQSNYYCAELISASSPDKITSSLTNLYKLLNNLSRLCEINIISAEHREIHELALSLGGSAKPSGAGGGDISIAWVPKLCRENFLAGLRNLGFAVLPTSKSI